METQCIIGIKDYSDRERDMEETKGCKNEGGELKLLRRLHHRSRRQTEQEDGVEQGTGVPWREMIAGRRDGV